MSLVEEITCSHCGAPISLEPGEILATCKYCGYTVVIETGKAFSFEHSMLTNRFDPKTIESPIRSWMREGFLKSPDLVKRSKIVETELVYLPFWIASVEAVSVYKGIFERLSPPIVKEGRIEKKYSWLILARKATRFPTREYDVPLAGKIPYDFKKIEPFAKVLNSEIDRTEAMERTRGEIQDHHRFLISQDVDRIIEVRDTIDITQMVYLHSPIWFAKYEYKGRIHQLLIDGADGNTIKGDIPSTGFGLL